MKKSLYSLMLGDDVVAAIDRMAHRLGTNRSALINSVLADYASVVTPERRINDIFAQINAVFGDKSDIIPFPTQSQSTLALRSNLNFKYRPTVKYEVELHTGSDIIDGTLTVFLRTQSQPLISVTNGFFAVIMHIEQEYLPNKIGYSLSDGRFTRTISPTGTVSGENGIGDAISAYINMFDEMLKGYVCGELSSADIERIYVSHLSGAKLII